ncbi:MAG TPA: hypothetical protein VM328_07340 [Fimbriimonadaceae bacterium]|nr:hypothetical protein [Fimbriimonadaceae bacterium]
MRHHLNEEHPLRTFFGKVLHHSLVDQLGLNDQEVERYLVEMLVEFLHNDRIYLIRDAEGRRVETVAEMVVEGDVRLNASSFDREREVHRHIGDFLLFWSGVFPEFLKRMKRPGSLDALVDVVRQGKTSYHIVSTFEHDPYGQQAPVFRKLSDRFEAYQYGLTLVRGSFEGLAAKRWREGFDA